MVVGAGFNTLMGVGGFYVLLYLLEAGFEVVGGELLWVGVSVLLLGALTKIFLFIAVFTIVIFYILFGIIFTVKFLLTTILR